MLIYDTLKRRKRRFVPIRKNEVRIYTCGPSVYSEPHIGNFRTYVFEDVVKRVLLYNGYRVRHIMNITDVEDKAVHEARGRMRIMMRIARKNERIFMKYARALNILPADHYPRATENIPYMVSMIRKLLRKKFAYADEKSNVFFDVSRFRGYGKLSHARFKNKLNKRILKDDYSPQEAGDFALWKGWRKSDGDVFWDTKLGRGRPGWHIECSAMSIRYLGAPFDIHVGGVDNIFAHHENEIAQTRCATGRMPARYWMHVRHLIVYGRKMSKSLGNIYTVRDLRRMGYGYDAIRAYFLTQHYRRRLNFTFSGLRATARELAKCKRLIPTLAQNIFSSENYEADNIIANAMKEFSAHINNDFDIPRAIKTLCSLVNRLDRFAKKKKLGKRNAKNALQAIRKMDSVLGFIFPRASST
ncbi:MAG: cysteine--tRNA ligase [Candidatus Micrarchaeia archaeon]